MEKRTNAMAKGPFYYWSKNGSGPNSLLETLKSHYTRLAASYLQKSMKAESALFAEVAEEFSRLSAEIKPLLDQDSDDQSNNAEDTLQFENDA